MRSEAFSPEACGRTPVSETITPIDSLTVCELVVLLDEARDGEMRLEPTKCAEIPDKPRASESTWRGFV